MLYKCLIINYLAYYLLSCSSKIGAKHAPQGDIKGRKFYPLRRYSNGAGHNHGDARRRHTATGKNARHNEPRSSRGGPRSTATATAEAAPRRHARRLDIITAGDNFKTRGASNFKRRFLSLAIIKAQF